MLKNKFRGQIDVDPDVAEQACIADYRAMIKAKLDEVEKAAKEHREAWEGEQAAKLIALQIKATEEQIKREEEEKAAKLKELRGETPAELPKPILDDEEIAKLKKEAEEAELIVLAAQELERKLELQKKLDYESKQNQLLHRIEELKEQLEDTQCKGSVSSFSKQ